MQKKSFHLQITFFKILVITLKKINFMLKAKQTIIKHIYSKFITSFTFNFNNKIFNDKIFGSGHELPDLQTSLVPDDVDQQLKDFDRMPPIVLLTLFCFVRQCSFGNKQQAL